MLLIGFENMSISERLPESVCGREVRADLKTLYLKLKAFVKSKVCVITASKIPSY